LKSSRIKLTEEDIPTLAEVNSALKEINVSKNNPYQVIDLGNGFTIEATVSGDNVVVESTKSVSAKAATIYSATAKGSFSVKALGITLAVQ